MIELLVVIGIIAVLSVVVLLVLNPVELLRAARDSRRLQDLQMINTALRLYQTDIPGATFGSPSVVYIYIPDSDPGCANTGLTPPAGWTFYCSPSSTFRNADGTGWLPVNFGNMSFNPNLPVLPIDPTNTTSSGYYYTFVAGSWELNAAMESQRYRSDLIQDGGDDTTLLEIGNHLTVAPLRPNSQSVQVYSITPSTGVNNNTVSITSISGQGFVSGASVKLMKTGQTDITGTGFSVTNGTTITGGSFNISGAAVGQWDLKVINLDNSSNTASNAFTITAPGAPAPSISSLSPNFGTQGSSSLVVTVNGANFVNTPSLPTVLFSGTGITQVGSPTYVNSSTLTVTINIAGGATVGARSVTVTNPDTQTSNASTFTVNAAAAPAPSIFSLSPSAGNQATNNLVVQVNGADFVSGATVVFGGAGITNVGSPTFVNSTRIDVTINVSSTAPVGVRSVTVTNPDLQFNTENFFTVNYDANLKGYWRMNDTPGIPVADATANGNTGNASGSPAWLSGASCKEGGCLEFNGSDNYVSVPHAASIDFDAAPLSLSVWVYPTSVLNGKEIVRKNAQLRFALNSASTVLFDNFTSSGLTFTSYAPPVGAWTHLVAVISSPTTGAAYVNGNSVASSFVGSWAPSSTAVNPFNFPYNTSFAGRLDAVRVYNKALTATEVRDIFNAGN